MDLKGIGRDVGCTNSISSWTRQWNHQQCKDCFFHHLQGKRRKIQAWEAARGVDGWGGALVQPTEGTAGEIFTLLALPHVYHSHAVFLTNTQSYDKNKSIFFSGFLWRQLACIPRIASAFTRQHLSAAEIPMQIYSLPLFQVAFLHTFGGEKNLIYNTVRVFCCFYKIFSRYHKITHTKSLICTFSNEKLKYLKFITRIYNFNPNLHSHFHG